jgi:hypothetical protein
MKKVPLKHKGSAQGDARRNQGKLLHDGAMWLAERKAHAPLPAGAHVDHGVGVVVTKNHRNKAAGRGCHDASCWASFIAANCALHLSIHENDSSNADSRSARATLLLKS